MELNLRVMKELRNKVPIERWKDAKITSSNIDDSILLISDFMYEEFRYAHLPKANKLKKLLSVLNCFRNNSCEEIPVLLECIKIVMEFIDSLPSSSKLQAAKLIKMLEVACNREINLEINLEVS